MKTTHSPFLLVVGLLAVSAPVPNRALAQEKPKVQVQIPDPGVPEGMTMEGSFVRAAYNNEGYVILGYQLANRSLGEEWMLLEVGVTLRDGVRYQRLKREDLSLDTPDGKTVALATISEHRAGDTRALEAREKVQRDSINYFPPSASQACRIGFFADLSSPAMPFDETELSSTRACLGRLYFKVPGGVAYGQHWLNVKFENSLVRVPFRILTKDEEKLMSKNYKDIKKPPARSGRKSRPSRRHACRPMKLPLVILVILAAAPAAAQDMEPKAYSASPVGATFLVLSGVRSSGSVVFDPTVPITDVKAEINAAVIGVGTTFGLFGKLALFSAALPYSWGDISGQVAGSSLDQPLRPGRHPPEAVRQPRRQSGHARPRVRQGAAEDDRRRKRDGAGAEWRVRSHQAHQPR